MSISNVFDKTDNRHSKKDQNLIPSCPAVSLQTVSYSSSGISPMLPPLKLLAGCKLDAFGSRVTSTGSSNSAEVSLVHPCKADFKMNILSVLVV